MCYGVRHTILWSNSSFPCQINRDCLPTLWDKTTFQWFHCLESFLQLAVWLSPYKTQDAKLAEAHFWTTLTEGWFHCPSSTGFQAGFSQEDTQLLVSLQAWILTKLCLSASCFSSPAKQYQMHLSDARWQKAEPFLFVLHLILSSVQRVGLAELSSLFPGLLPTKITSPHCLYL